MAYTYLKGVQLLQAVNTIMLAYCGAAWRDILHIQVLIIRPIINSFLHWEIHDTRTHPVRSLHQALAGVARTLGRALSYYALQCHWWLATTSVSLIPTKLNKIWLAKYNMILVQSRAIIRPCCVCRSTIPSILWSPELLCSLSWKVPSAYLMGIIMGGNCIEGVQVVSCQFTISTANQGLPSFLHFHRAGWSGVCKISMYTHQCGNDVQPTLCCTLSRRCRITFRNWHPAACIYLRSSWTHANFFVTERARGCGVNIYSTDDNRGTCCYYSDINCRMQIFNHIWLRVLRSKRKVKVLTTCYVDYQIGTRTCCCRPEYSFVRLNQHCR